MGKRFGWEFSQLTKEIAWRQAVERDEIPEDADPRDYEFHHQVPVEVARRRGMCPALIRAAWNCLPLHKEHHKMLHHWHSNEELANSINDVPLQPRLPFED